MLRQSTFSVADGHLKVHLEADWNEIPVEHIDIDAVNEWMWKKRQAELSWVTITTPSTKLMTLFNWRRI
jgi:hypothetical protein